MTVSERRVIPDRKGKRTVSLPAGRCLGKTGIILEASVQAGFPCSGFDTFTVLENNSLPPFFPGSLADAFAIIL